MASSPVGASSGGKKDQPDDLSEKLIMAIQNHRRGLITGLIVLVILAAGFIVALGVREFLQDKAIITVEDFNERYQALRPVINEPAQETEADALLDELNRFGDTAFAYAKARSYAIAAAIYTDRKDWGNAEAAWAKAAKAAGKNYLRPLFLFNAGVAAEGRGDSEQAIRYYRESLVLSEIFPLAVRAQFAVGRLLEELRRYDEAVEAYEELIEKWPLETEWTNFANSRIITLGLSGGA